MPADIPVHIVAQLDQDHAEAATKFDRFLNGCIADGLADFAAPELVLGTALALRDETYEELLELASHAISRLIEQETR